MDTENRLRRLIYQEFKGLNISILFEYTSKRLYLEWLMDERTTQTEPYTHCASHIFMNHEKQEKDDLKLLKAINENLKKEKIKLTQFNTDVATAGLNNSPYLVN